MRLAFSVAGVLLLISSLLFYGLVWRVSAPARFDGVDRDPAVAIGAGTPAELVRPGVARRELVDMLRNRDFGALTQIVENRNQRAVADPREEHEMARVLRAFHIDDESLTPTFNQWAETRSFAPLLARAEHRYALAYRARGTDSARNTTDEQFLQMRDQLLLMFTDLERALEIEPKIGEAYRLRIHGVSLSGTQRDCGLAAEQGLTLLPASFGIRWALAQCRLPRWGGSHALVQAIADRAMPFVADNPDLQALQGVVEWDLGRSTKGDQALVHYEAAIAAGQSPAFYEARARWFRGEKNYRSALQDLDAGLTLSPDDPNLLMLRMFTLVELGRANETPAILTLVEAIDPLNRRLDEFRKFAADYAEYEEQQRAQRAGTAVAMEALNRQIAESGGSAEAYYSRGRAFLKSNDHNNALIDFNKALEVDPSHFESVLNIDYILFQRREYDRIIEYWNAYLAVKPDDGMAYMERAGTYHHAGNEAKSTEDIKKACELNVAQACARFKQ
jgi:tetratricopeptide (TPR) repeat protein